MDPLTHCELDAGTLRDWPLPALGGGVDKEERGCVLIVAGSREIPGAAILSATAAARAGAGKLLLAAPESVAAGIALAMPEARVIGLRESADGQLATSAAAQLAGFLGAIDALLIGPGLAGGPATTQFAAELLAHFNSIPVVLDASAMDVVMRGERFDQPLLLTPHCGEMAHLTGHSKESLAGGAAAAAAHYAGQWQAVVALKGATTWIAEPGHCLWRHAGGHPGLATSGSGDVLAGLITGLAARGATLAQACAWGVVTHGLAGRRLAQRLAPPASRPARDRESDLQAPPSRSDRRLGYLARELLPEIPGVLVELAELGDSTPPSSFSPWP